MNTPRHASEIPFVPMNFTNRDILVGQLMEVLELAIPEGKQLDALKSVVKKTISQHFTQSFNEQFEALVVISQQINSPKQNDVDLSNGWMNKYHIALWEATQNDKPPIVNSHKEPVK